MLSRLLILIVLLALLVLQGCVTNGQIVNVPVEVAIPIPAPCFSAPVNKPVWVLDDPQTLVTGVYSKARAVIRELEQRRAYERLLEAATVECTRSIE